MANSDKGLISTLLFITPGVAFAHDPLKGVLMMGGIYLFPGIISAIIAEQNKLFWFFISIPLAILSLFLLFTYTISFVTGLAISSTVVPIVLWQNAKAWKQKNNET